MPCDTIQTSELELAHANTDLLMKALEGLGLRPRLSNGTITFAGGTYSNGRLEVSGGRSQRILDEKLQTIRTAYSKQIVSYAAKQFGWTVREDTKAVLRPGVKAVMKLRKN